MQRQSFPLAFELVYSLFKEQYPLENDDEGNQYLCLPGTGQRLSSKEVLGEIKRISEIYRNLVNKQEEIDFGPPVVRFAYIYKYVPVHIRMVQKVLEDWNRQGCELRTLMSQKTISVCCLGGGPGSDIFGLLRFLDSMDTKPILQASIYDRESLWGETWNSISTELMHKHGIFMTTAYHSMNLSDRATERTLMQTDFGKFNLFMLIKFWSSVYKSEVAKNSLSLIFSRAKPGSYVLYIDNKDKERKFLTGLSEILPEANWQKVFENSFDRDTERFPLSRKEDKQLLKEYFEFLQWSPLLNPSVCVSVFKKVA